MEKEIRRLKKIENGITIALTVVFVALASVTFI